VKPVGEGLLSDLHLEWKDADDMQGLPADAMAGVRLAVDKLGLLWPGILLNIHLPRQEIWAPVSYKILAEMAPCNWPVVDVSWATYFSC
jgi:hypothetical protein